VDVTLADVNSNGCPDVIGVLPNKLRVLLNSNGTLPSVPGSSEFSTTLL
jgi:hypothetical protein